MGAVEALLRELAAAGEADFDGMLSEALEALSEGKTAEVASPVTVSEEGAVRAAAQHLRRGDLAKSKRDYTTAEICAAHVRSQAVAFAQAAATLKRARQSYVEAVDGLRVELEAIGEADFDGLLRQAVSTLQPHEKASRVKQAAADTRVPPVPTTAKVMCAEAPPPAAKPTPRPAAKPTSPRPPPVSPAPIPLKVEEVDEGGCVWLGTLPPALQAALLREAFAPGAVGVCGGLVEGRRTRGV